MLRTSHYGCQMSVFLPRKRSSYWPLPRLSGVVKSTPFRILSLTLWHWGEVSFTFIPGFVAKRQDPSSSAPRFEGFTVPALPNASANRNGRLLCLVRAVRCYLDHTAAHHPRCKRLFFTAGRSMKEIAKYTVSFWLQKTISRAYQLSGRSVPDPPPRYRSVSSVQEELRCQPGVEGGYMAQAHHLHASLPQGPCA